MRIAALYDIHGNLPALEAVLQEIASAHVDQLVIGGDVLAGPMPHETLNCLRDLTIPTTFIHGNADREVLAQAAGQEAGAVPEAVLEIIRWVTAQLSSEEIAIVAEWPTTTTLEMPSLGRVLFCHATPQNDTDVFTKLTPEALLLPLFDEVDADLVICGHTHMQFDRTIGQTRVVNAGSVGMPYGQPGAYWVLLGETVEFRRTLYDREQAAARVCATTYPQAEKFAAQNLVQVPTEEEALMVFTQMATRATYQPN